MIDFADEGGWNLRRVDPDGKATALIPPQMWMYSSAAAPDGRSLAYSSNTGAGSLWLLKNF